MTELISSPKIISNVEIKFYLGVFVSLFLYVSNRTAKYYRVEKHNTED